MSKEDQNKQQKGGKPEGKGPAKEGGKDAKRGGPGGAKKSPVQHEAAEADSGPRVPPRLQVQYDQSVRAKLGEQFGLKNPMAQPRIDKIVVNVNMGRHLEGAKIPPHVRGQVLDTINKVTGQKPVVLKAKKSVSNFKVREGLETAAMVTMRRDRMWHFLDRLINLATPRIKDFRGLPDKAFDKQGNYAMGLTEQGVFPEINMAEAQFTHGMNINVCFRNSNPKLSKFVLEQLGMPFRKPDQK
ncbi:MAG: 50S ribosomal protein L5 [Phycisphaerae bacterium]|nr:50S ribosomal protein L5 [Phycisphaerae bacterium]